MLFFFASRRRHTRLQGDWSSDVCSSDLTREGCSLRRVTMMLSLAFLAPSLVKAAADGQLPRGIGVSRLFDPPAEIGRASCREREEVPGVAAVTEKTQ